MSPEKLNQLKSKLESYSSRTMHDDEIMDRMEGQPNNKQITMLIEYVTKKILAEDLLEEFFGGQE